MQGLCTENIAGCYISFPSSKYNIIAAGIIWATEVGKQDIHSPQPIIAVFLIVL